MLEGVVSSVLTTYLGKYIEGLDQVAVSVGIKSGNVKLSNLRVKLDALQDFHVPVKIRAGEIKHLELSIPWSNLKTDPAIISIEGLYLRLRPTQVDDNSEEYLRRELKTKLSQLAIAEMIYASNLASNEVEEEDNSWTTNITNTIIANIQIHIKSVHVRYEGLNNSPPFAFGFTINSLQLQTTNSDYVPAMLTGNEYLKAESVFKLATLSHLSFYWDTDVKPMPSGRNTRNRIMDEMIYRGEDWGKGEGEEIVKREGELCYIIRPFSNSFRLRLNKKYGFNDLPKVTAQMVIQDLGLFLKKYQIWQAFDFANDLSGYLNNIKYTKYKTEEHQLLLKKIKKNEEDEGEREGEEEERKRLAICRWGFCGRAVRGDIEERRKKWRWEEMKRTREETKKYVELYVKKKKKGEKVKKEEEKEVERLERELGYWVLLFGRKLAADYLLKDKKYQEEVKRQTQEQQGWGGWVSSWFTPTGEEEAQKRELELTPDLFKELSARFGEEDEDNSVGATAPTLSGCLSVRNFQLMFLQDDTSSEQDKFYGKFQVDSLTLTATLMSRSSPSSLASSSSSSSSFPTLPSPSLTNTPMTPTMTNTTNTTNTNMFRVECEGLSALDGSLPCTLFPTLLDVRERGGEEGGEGRGKFLDMTVVQKKIENIDHISVTGVVYPSTIVISLPFFESLCRFFTPPNEHKSALHNLGKESYAYMQSLTEDTRETLNQTLVNSDKVVDVNVTLHGPRIVVPLDNLSSTTPVLFWDMGTLTISSALPPPLPSSSTASFLSPSRFPFSLSSPQRLSCASLTTSAFSSPSSVTGTFSSPSYPSYPLPSERFSSSFSHFEEGMWGGGGGEGIEYGGAGYRHFDVTLKDCLAWVGTEKHMNRNREGKETRKELEEKGLVPFVQPSELSIKLHVSRFDVTTVLPSVGIEGELPSLVLRLSPEEIAQCLCIIDKFSENETYIAAFSSSSSSPPPPSSFSSSSSSSSSSLPLSTSQPTKKSTGLSSLPIIQKFYDNGAQFDDNRELFGNNNERNSEGDPLAKYRNAHKYGNMTKPDTFDLKVDFRIPLIELVVLLDENSGEILESVGGKGGGKGGKESPFVLRIEEVGVNCRFTKATTIIEGDVLSLSLTDNVSGEGKWLILSSKETEQHQQKKLVNIKMNKTLRGSDKFCGVDTHFEVKMEELSVWFRRRSIVFLQCLIDYFLRCYDHWEEVVIEKEKEREKEREGEGGKLMEEEVEEEKGKEKEKAKKFQEDVIYILVDAHLSSVSLFLVLEEEEDGEGVKKEKCMGSVTMSGAEFGFVQGTDGDKYMTGTILDLDLEDNYSENTCWRNILQSDGRGSSPLATFQIAWEFPKKPSLPPPSSFSPFSPSSSPSFPPPFQNGLNQVKLKLTRPQVVIYTPLLMFFFEFFTEYLSLLTVGSVKMREVELVGGRGEGWEGGKREGKGGEERKKGGGGEDVVILFDVMLDDFSVVLPSRQKRNGSFIFGEAQSLRVRNYKHYQPQHPQQPLIFSKIPLDYPIVVVGDREEGEGEEEEEGEEVVKAKLKKGEEVRGMMLVTDMVLDVVKLESIIPNCPSWSYEKRKQEREQERKQEEEIEGGRGEVGVTLCTVNGVAVQAVLPSEVPLSSLFPSLSTLTNIPSNKLQIFIHSPSFSSLLPSLALSPLPVSSLVKEGDCLVVVEKGEGWWGEKNGRKETGETGEKEEEGGWGWEVGGGEKVRVVSSRFLLSKRDRERFLPPAFCDVFLETSFDAQVKSFAPLPRPPPSPSSSSFSQSPTLIPSSLLPALSVSLLLPSLSFSPSQTSLNLFSDTLLHNFLKPPPTSALLTSSLSSFSFSSSSSPSSFSSPSLTHRLPTNLLMSVDVQIKKIFSTFRGVGEETGVVVWGEGVVVGQEVREGGGEVRVTVERVVVDGVVGDGEEELICSLEKDPLCSSTISSSLFFPIEGGSTPQISLRTVTKKNNTESELKISESRVIVNPSFASAMAFFQAVGFDFNYVIAKEQEQFDKAQEKKDKEKQKIEGEEKGREVVARWKIEMKKSEVFFQPEKEEKTDLYLLEYQDLKVVLLQSEQGILAFEVSSKGNSLLRNVRGGGREGGIMGGEVVRIMEPVDVHMFMGCPTPTLTKITLQRMEGCALTFSYQDLIGLSNVSTCLMQVTEALNAPYEHSYIAVNNLVPPAQVLDITYMIDIADLNFEFNFVDEAAGFALPLLHGEVGVRDGLYEMAETGNKFTLHFRQQIDFYNRSKETWEPLLENFQSKVQFRRKKLEANQILDEISIDTHEDVEVSLSAPMISTLLSAVQEAQKVISAEQQLVKGSWSQSSSSVNLSDHPFVMDPETKRFSRATHVIKNRTGLQFSYLFPDQLNLQKLEVNQQKAARLVKKTEQGLVGRVVDLRKDNKEMRYLSVKLDGPSIQLMSPALLPPSQHSNPLYPSFTIVPHSSSVLFPTPPSSSAPVLSPVPILFPTKLSHTEGGEGEEGGEREPKNEIEIMREREDEREKETKKSVAMMRSDMSFDVPIDKKVQLCRSFPNMEADVICSVYLRNGHQMIDVRSRILIENKTKERIVIGCFNPSSSFAPSSPSSSSCFELFVGPGEQEAIPLVYMQRGNIRFRLRDKPCNLSNTPLSIPALLSPNAISFRQIALCTVTNSKRCKPYYLRQCIQTQKPDSFSTTIELYPTLVLMNALPERLFYRIFLKENNSLFKEGGLNQGEEVDMFENYHEKEFFICISLGGFTWSPPLVYDRKRKKSRKVRLTDPEGRGLNLNFYEFRDKRGQNCMTVFCEFWVVNKTGLPLVYKQQGTRGSELPRMQEVERKVFSLRGPQSQWYPPTIKQEKHPFLFRPHGDPKLCVQVASGSAWSEGVLLSNAPFVGMFEMEEQQQQQQQQQQKLYQLGISSVRATGVFWRTMIVTLAPRYVLINQTTSPLEFKQTGASSDFLAAGGSAPFHWDNKKTEKLFQFRVTAEDKLPQNLRNWDKKQARDLTDGTPPTYFSGLIALESLDTLVLPLQLTNASNSPSEVIEDTLVPPGLVFYVASGRVVDGVTHVIISHQGSKTVPPFRIQNMTKYDVTVHQSTNLERKGFPSYKKEIVIAPGKTTGWTFTEPFIFEKKIVFYSSHSTLPSSSSYSSSFSSSYSPNPVATPSQSSSYSSFSSSYSSSYSSYSSGSSLSPPTPTISPITPNLSEGGSFCPFSSLPSSVGGLYLREETEGATLVFSLCETKEQAKKDTKVILNPKKQDEVIFKQSIKMKVGRVGVSVLDDKMHEFMYLSLFKLDLRLREDNLIRRMKFSLSNFQVDNQLFRRYYPVAVCPGKDFDESKAYLEIDFQQTLDNRTVLVDFFDVQAQELDIRMDSEMVLKMISTFGVNLGFGEDSTTAPCDFDTEEQFPLIPKSLQSSTEPTILFLRSLSISPLSVILSFFAYEPKEEVGEGQEGEPLEESSWSQLTQYSLASFVLNITDASFHLSNLAQTNLRIEAEEVLPRLAAHYTQSLRHQAYRIVGASNSLGSPIIFLSGVKHGVRDLIHEPIKGYKEEKNITGLGSGIAKGSSSMVKSSVGGALGSTASLSGAMARGLGATSSDEDFKKKQEETRRTKATGLRSGFSSGIHSLGRGFKSGVKGVVADPLHGAKEDGIVGFGKGMASGVTGIITKPTAGVMTLVSKTAEGIQASRCQTGRRIDRVRLPRFIGPEKVIIKYNAEKAAGQFMFYDKMDVEYHVNQFLDVISIPHSHYYLLFTNKHIILVCSEPRDKGEVYKVSVIRQREINSISSVSNSQLDQHGGDHRQQRFCVRILSPQERPLDIIVPRDNLLEMKSLIQTKVEQIRGNSINPSIPIFSSPSSLQQPFFSPSSSSSSATLISLPSPAPSSPAAPLFHVSSPSPSLSPSPLHPSSSSPSPLPAAPLSPTRNYSYSSYSSYSSSSSYSSYSYSTQNPTPPTTPSPPSPSPAFFSPTSLTPQKKE